MIAGAKAIAEAVAAVKEIQRTLRRAAVRTPRKRHREYSGK